MPTPRILVADDNPLSLRFLAEALTAASCECVEAGDGAIALQLACASRFDLLLLDARMPGLDGADVLARVRAHIGPSQHAQALATTADDDASTSAALRAAGFSAVLIKPVLVAGLHAAISPYLSLPASAHRFLDEAHALRAAGGDAAIVDALRALFVCELEALPGELAAIGASADADALRERLHRLDASAGLCGVPALADAAATLRSRLDEPRWPAGPLNDFVAVSERVRLLLAR